jgi:broad specificity phosphatase PhoE
VDRIPVSLLMRYTCQMLKHVGLLRHYPVSRHYLTRQRMNSEEFGRWLEEYDTLPIIPGDLHLDDQDWQTCYASDLKRAVETARLVYSGPIQTTPDLREITLHPPFHTRRRLPILLWDLSARYAWRKGFRSQTETQKHTWERTRRFINRLETNPETNVLVVAHGGILWHLRQELLERGFTGPRFTIAENGRLYEFQATGQDAES